MSETFAQKALARAAGLEHVAVGQIVDARPDMVLSHDNTAAIARLFGSLGQGRVLHPERMAVVLDHAVAAAHGRARGEPRRGAPVCGRAGHSRTSTMSAGASATRW